MKKQINKIVLTGLISATTLVSSWNLAGAQEKSDKLQEQQMDDVVVTSTKLDRKLEHMTDSVIIINEEEIKVKGYTDLTEVLRLTPSIEFKQAGGPGQFSYPKMRGYGQGHFLVLVNGMKINEAYSSGVGNFIGQLDTKLLESVEILRGPQASLYGSDTTAGVMAFTTIAGQQGTHFNAGIEYGSLDWKKGYGSVRGGTEKWDYAVGLAYTDSEGVHDKEYYKNFSPTMKFGLHRDTFDLTFSYLYVDSEFQAAELNQTYSFLNDRSDFWSFQTPDPDNANKYEHNIATLQAEHRFAENMRNKVVLGWFEKKSERNDLDNGFLGYETAPFDNFRFNGVTYNAGDRFPIYDDGDGRAYGNDHENLMFDYNFIWDMPLASAGSNSLLLGFEYLYQEGGKWGKYGDLKADIYNFSFYANDQLLLLNDALILSAGLRHDHHKVFGGETTGKAGAAYSIAGIGTTLFSNYGTSFRAPTFFNLYDARYGDEDITPEEGWTVEGGVRQLLGKRADVEVTYWYSELDNVIVFDYTIPNPNSSVGSGKYANRDSAMTEGIEVAFGYYFTDQLSLSGNYTYTESKNEKNNETFRTVQIARNKGSLTLEYLGDNYSLAATAYYTGPRLRWKGDIEMKEYIRCDLSGRYEVVDGLNLYTRLENIFDENIEEGMGYEQPGFYGIIGLEWDMSL